MSKATDDVLAERQRQITAEGWTEDHDDQHTDGSLARVAACYAHPGDMVWAETDDGRQLAVPSRWPENWHPEWWKLKGRRRNLVRAAALLVAEIERLDRIAARV